MVSFPTLNLLLCILPRFPAWTYRAKPPLGTGYNFQPLGLHDIPALFLFPFPPIFWTPPSQVIGGGEFLSEPIEPPLLPLQLPELQETCFVPST